MPLSTAASAAIERAEEQSQPSVGGALGGVGVPAVEGERADARPVGVCHEFCRGACRRSPPDRVVWRPVAGVKPSRIFCIRRNSAVVIGASRWMPTLVRKSGHGLRSNQEPCKIADSASRRRRHALRWSNKHGPQYLDKTAAAGKESAAGQGFLIRDACPGSNPGLLS